MSLVADPIFRTIIGLKEQLFDYSFYFYQIISTFNCAIDCTN